MKQNPASIGSMLQANNNKSKIVALEQTDTLVKQREAISFNRKQIELIRNDLLNPFKLTKIKLLGDSITAGVGGTGYSATGETIFSNYKANTTTATCWANMLKEYLESNYQTYKYVGSVDSRVVKTGTGVTEEINSDGALKKHVRFENTNNTDKLEFTFYGEKFGLMFVTYGSSGIADIKVDSVSIATLDCYSSTFVWDNEIEYNVALGQHTVEVVCTNTKNPLSAGNRVYIQGVKIPKIVEVKNWGISGRDSEFIYQNIANLTDSNDDFVLLQVGTNDRQFPQLFTQTMQREIVNAIVANGSTPILMVAPQASSANENLYPWEMKDINLAIKELATEKTKEYISNYDFTKKYTELSNTLIDSLLDDGLHPNDTLYTLLFENIKANLML